MTAPAGSTSAELTGLPPAMNIAARVDGEFLVNGDTFTAPVAAPQTFTTLEDSEWVWHSWRGAGLCEWAGHPWWGVGLCEWAGHPW